MEELRSGRSAEVVIADVCFVCRCSRLYWTDRICLRRYVVTGRGPLQFIYLVAEIGRMSSDQRDQYATCSVLPFLSKPFIEVDYMTSGRSDGLVWRSRMSCRRRGVCNDQADDIPRKTRP
jgi:hypothetical protein